MTIREQLEKEMIEQEIKETEEENADSKEYVEMDNSDTNNWPNADWSYPNQSALDSRRQCGFSVFNGNTIMVCAKKSKRIYGVL